MSVWGQWRLALLLIGRSSFMRRFVVTVFGTAVIIITMVSVPDRRLAPEEVDVVLQREQVHGTSSQDVRLVFSVHRIAGILE